MSRGPRQLSLFATLAAPDLGAAVRLVLGAARNLPGLPPPVGWRIGDTAAPTETREPESFSRETNAVDLVYPTEDDWGLVRREPNPAIFTLRLDYWTDDRPGLDLSALLQAMVELCRRLLRAEALKSAALVRHLGGHCLPEVPLVSPAAHLALTSEPAVIQAYAEPSVFFAAWDQVENYGDLRLCSRGLSTPENPAFLRHILTRHLAMLRAARPALVRFSQPRFEEGEFELLNAGEPTLTGVGYFAKDQVYEFAGHLPPGTELRAIDLFNAWRIAATGQLEGAGPIREVRAVFMDQAQARRAAPLLLAAGVVPAWDDENGTTQRIDPT